MCFHPQAYSWNSTYYVQAFKNMDIANTSKFLWAIVAAISFSGLLSLQSLYFLMWKWRSTKSHIVELEAALAIALKQRAAERTGRIRAQRELRQALLGGKNLKEGNVVAYPMTPIGTVRSCFSTRNGTPRQPMLVSLARASLVLSSKGVPAESLDGLLKYSHCWLLYVFHENTDLPSLWKQPAHKDFKAKVRVPRLEGGKLGVFATRTPHRPCPIGLTVAKVEGIKGATLLLSGADLVDGTPVLDIKPYLPYCDSVPESSAPSWVQAGGEDDVIAMASVSFTENFATELAKCWDVMGKNSLYSSQVEIQSLVEQVLSRDIRSLNQRQRPHNGKVVYHLILEGINVSYSLEQEGVVVVEGAALDCSFKHICSRDTDPRSWRHLFHKS
ncbi:unnamed protein product [Sphagnum troendelagicum]|uniref:TsaA-like domain-containing protein n=1 Tax=Sphagnum troendelagicum TaxID=128251 RepID=A0ABP0TAV2_9BRYO